MPLPFFDSHLHIIDPRFPLSRNQGFLPEPFTVDDYRACLEDLSSLITMVGGAVVSASFQMYDQSYLLDALDQLGPGFAGVTQIPLDYPDSGILSLHRQGVRAVRFNGKRGGSESLSHIEELSDRVRSLVGWHVEFYIDSKDLETPEDLKPRNGLQDRGSLLDRMLGLQQIVIDHLGLSEAGLPALLRLVEAGAMVKATGLHRGDLNWLEAMKKIHAVNPGALMFGTDLPSTRAPFPFQRSDLERVLDAFPESELMRILCTNGQRLYGKADG